MVSRYLRTGDDSADDEDDKKEALIGTCSVHLRQRNIPNLSKYLVDKKQSSKFLRDIERVRTFHAPYFEKAWGAMRAFWIEHGEEKIIEKFEQNHIEKACGWYSGLFAFGLPSHTNSLESHNKLFRQGIRIAMTGTTNKRPQLEPFLRGVFYHFLPIWSL